MKINSAEFVISAADAQQFPKTDHPEIAFAGKSNVGKSTLINSMLNRRNLVKTSATPGKTRLVNFFLINKSFSLVDLPGYGFAKVSRAMQKEWGQLIELYLSQRPSLRGVILIVDSRHGPSAGDLQMQEWLDHYNLPVLVIANKIDKLKRSQVLRQLKDIQTKMGLSTVPIAHSSLKKLGREEIWKALHPWLSQ
ncbi:MAG: YihA family ribosome biogenesis GTP-binding protein [SAR324 cluster bacterium]|nr:YihA family ribosome biogenesis GTP-binding protein [SAR324 cluster bacterium]